MANIKSAAKRARQSKRLAQANRTVIDAMKLELKKSRKAVIAKDKTAAAAALPIVSAKLDKAVKTGRIHRNKANRLKSRAAKKVNALAAA